MILCGVIFIITVGNFHGIVHKACYRAVISGILGAAERKVTRIAAVRAEKAVAGGKDIAVRASGAVFRSAVLIDTDNVSSKYMGALEEELIALGKVTYRRMYGDFARNGAEGWRKIVNDYALTPVQQYTYTTGKNATDFRIVIDAMDILYSGNVNAICLLSSDSDFTGLVKRLKEGNIFVIGAGEKKTPQSFVKACDRFFVLQDPTAKEESEKKPEQKKKGKAPAPKEESQEETTVEEQPLTREEVEDFAVSILESADAARCALPYLMKVT